MVAPKVKTVPVVVTKPGYLTTEFLLTVVILLCATVALAVGAIDADKWMIFMTGSSGLYSLSRGWAKSSPPSVSDPAAPVD